VVLQQGGEKRLAALDRLVHDFWPGWSLVIPMAQWPTDLLGSLTRKAALAPSPRGKGSPGPASVVETRLSSGQGEGPSG
jgi:hypothetical protein